MPSTAPIAIADGASTPVTHTYAPRAIENRVASFQEVTSGVPIGYPKLTVSNREPVQGGAVYRVTLRLQVPKVITTTDASGKTVTSVNYVNSGEIALLLANSSEKQERKNIRVLLANLLLHSSTSSVVDDLEFFW